MIDIDKYKGHTLEYGMNSARLLEHLDTEPNRRLIADAPLLLAEVERLSDKLLRSLQWVEDRYGYATTGDFATVRDYIKFIGEEE